MSGRKLDAVMSGENRSLPAAIMRTCLRMGASAYRLAVTRRNRAFDRGLRTPIDLHRAVISVGNITTGGTGKTPVVLELANRLLRTGRKPAILLRGYQGKEVEPEFTRLGEGGPPPPQFISDEQMLYRDALGDDVPVGADPDRARSARHILYHRPETDVLILDDGFQHRQIKRDLDIVLIDATCPFGYDHMLPRGLLREPVDGLERATFVIVTRSDMVRPDELAGIDRRIMALTGAAPIAHAVHQWGGFVDNQGLTHNHDSLVDAKVFGVCGVGNPRAFESAAREKLEGLLHVEQLADHHDYTREQLDALFKQAADAGAEAMLTTDKDWVKMQPLLGETEPPLPIYRPILKVGFLKGGQQIDLFLRQLKQNVDQDSATLVLKD